MTFNLQVISSEKKLYEGDVNEVVLPTVNGEIAVLPKHMPLVTPLDLGVVSINKSDGTNVTYTIGKGLFFVEKSNASLLIEDVRSSDEISEADVEQARLKAQELIAKGITPEEKLQGTYLLRRSLRRRCEGRAGEAIGPMGIVGIMGPMGLMSPIGPMIPTLPIIPIWPSEKRCVSP